MKISTLLVLSFFMIPVKSDLLNSKETIKQQRNDSLVIDAYIDTIKHLGTRSLDSIKIYGYKALKYAQTKKYWQGELLINQLLSKKLCAHGSLAEAIIYSERAIKIAKQKGDTL